MQAAASGPYQGHGYNGSLSGPPSDRALPRAPFMDEDNYRDQPGSPPARPSSQFIVPSPSANQPRFPDNAYGQGGTPPNRSSWVDYPDGGGGGGSPRQQQFQYPQQQQPQRPQQYPQQQQQQQHPQQQQQQYQQYPQGSPRPQSQFDLERPQSQYTLTGRPQPQFDEDVQLSHEDPDPFFNSSGYSHNQPLQRSPAQRPTQPPSPPPILDHSHLRPGNQAALLSHEATLAHYRANAKRATDPELIFEFAVFMIEASKSLHVPPADATNSNQLEIEKATDKRDEIIREALALLKKIADRGHVNAQYFLADCYANGIGTVRNRQDFDRAFPLFVLAAKHGHPDAAYRAGTCLENGWGTRRESAKAVQFYKKAAAALHPGAMYRLGLADLNGDLGLNKSAKEGLIWLKRSAEHATEEFPHALHELALLHERGVENIVFVDNEYAAELLGQAAELGYAPSAHRLGECYEYGRMGCPQDPALSIHYYNIAAQQDHPEACFALTAWYLVGSPGVLPQSDTEAFLWAKKAANKGLTKAMYAIGYFYEVGIGTVQSMSDAMIYYRKAAEAGDKRATQRLKTTMHGSLPPPTGDPAAIRRELDAGAKDKKDCIIM